MGAAENPDINYYYDKSCEFPLTYSPKEDPGTRSDRRNAGRQQVAAAELESRENNSKGEDDGDESDESLASGGSGSEDNGPEEGWDDVDNEDGLTSTGNRLKRTKGTKLMSAIDKVHTMNFFECLRPS